MLNDVKKMVLFDINDTHTNYNIEYIFQSFFLKLTQNMTYIRSTLTIEVVKTADSTQSLSTVKVEYSVGFKCVHCKTYIRTVFDMLYPLTQ